MTRFLSWLFPSLARARQVIDDTARFDVFPDDDPIHLDPNGCLCDGCKQVVEVIRELLRLDSIAEADLTLWEIENDWWVPS